MPKTTMILNVDGERKTFVGEEISSVLPALENIQQTAEKVWVESMNIEGINAFNITQNGSDKLTYIISVFKMLEGSTPSDVAKYMYVSIFNKIDMLDAPHHIERIHAVERINGYNDFRAIAQATKGMFYYEWQGFEFLLN